MFEAAELKYPSRGRGGGGGGGLRVRAMPERQTFYILDILVFILLRDFCQYLASKINNHYQMISLHIIILWFSKR